MTQHVYFFGDGTAEGGATMKLLLGSKGANLAEMANIGIPVPPGFTVSTRVCLQYLAGNALPDDVRDQVKTAMGRLERATGRTFGGATNPLLVSVRSGGAVSMPGMMDTILNLGLNDRTAERLATASGNPRFAYDSYRRLVQMYGEVVFGIKNRPGHHDPFHAALDELKARRGAGRDIDLAADDLKGLVATVKDIVRPAAGTPSPQDARD